MKPYPFASLNHFTVPCAILPFLFDGAGLIAPVIPAPMAGASRSPAGQTKNAAGLSVLATSYLSDPSGSCDGERSDPTKHLNRDDFTTAENSVSRFDAQHPGR